MKVLIENLGILKKAEFELGDLTLVCGGNNTGKTYAAYALFGFLSEWRRFLKPEIPDRRIEELLKDGATRIDIAKHARKAERILSRGCERYAEFLPRLFASGDRHFEKTRFQVQLDMESVPPGPFEQKIRSGKSELFSLAKAEGSNDLAVSLLADTGKIELPSEALKEIISNNINEIIFGRHFPRPFIASAERTGVAIFSRELGFARSRLLEEMNWAGKNVDPTELLLKSHNDYAQPIRTDVDFMRRIPDIRKEDSFIAGEHPEILDRFTDIIGGEYVLGPGEAVYFKPKGKKLMLTMGESSSAVRSMVDIGFYLPHIAKPGDLLMVDEPELSLHPENQRRVARLFAQLANAGIRVFATTHSDYIVRELNTLIMLADQDKPHLKRVARRRNYLSAELLDAEKVKAYATEETLVKTNPNRRRSRQLTLTASDINREEGIDASTFDETINEMNEIQKDICQGDDE